MILKRRCDYRSKVFTVNIIGEGQQIVQSFKIPLKIVGKEEHNEIIKSKRKIV